MTSFLRNIIFITVAVQQVKSWFDNVFVNDGDIKEDLQLDINAMAKIVAQTGDEANGLLAVFYKSEYHSKTVMEIGILRYPDLDKPYFKVGIETSFDSFVLLV